MEIGNQNNSRLIESDPIDGSATVNKGGRPLSPDPRKLISLRLPADVLDSVVEVARQNPHLMTEIWAHGGHVGFVNGAIPFETHYYGEERVIEFLARQLDGTHP